MNVHNELLVKAAKREAHLPFLPKANNFWQLSSKGKKSR